MMNKISKDINLVKSVLFAEESNKVRYANINNPQEVEKAVKEAGWKKFSGKVTLPGYDVKYKWAYETSDDEGGIMILYYLNPWLNDYEVGVYCTEEGMMRGGGLALLDGIVNYDNLEIGPNYVTSHKNAPNKNASFAEEGLYAVIRTGGSTGEKPYSIVKDNLSHDEAIDMAKRYRKMLSPGEKNYYRITYKTVPMSKIGSSLSPGQQSNFAEESEKSIFVLGSRDDEVESALKKQGWVRVNELEDIPGEAKVKWQYSPKDNKDLIIALVHEFEGSMSVGLFINKYLWDPKGKYWKYSNPGSGFIYGYRIGKDSFTYRYGD